MCHHIGSYFILYYILKVCYYLVSLLSPAERFRGDIVLALSVRSLSVRPSVRTHILVLDFQIILSFYRNMNLHMRTAHTRFNCTATTGNIVMAFVSFNLGNGFSDFIIRCRTFRGGYYVGVVCPSFLIPSVWSAMDYGKLAKGAF